MDFGAPALPSGNLHSDGVKRWTLGQGLGGRGVRLGGGLGGGAQGRMGRLRNQIRLAERD